MKYKKEIDMITRAFNLNQNSPLSTDELRELMPFVKETVFYSILSEMFISELLVANNEKYQLSPTIYSQNIEQINKKRQSIIDANNRLLKIRDIFDNPYYKLEDAVKKYTSLLGNNNIDNFDSDMKTLGYVNTKGFLILNHTNIGEYLSSELLKINIIDMKQFSEKHKSLIENVTIDYLLEKLKQDYQIIEFDNDVFINIKQLNKMNIYISNIKEYCSEIYNKQKDGTCFSINSLKQDGFYHELDNLGFGNIFYENLLKYDNRFQYYKMTNSLVFSTKKRPHVSDIVFDELKRKKFLSIYELQNILTNQYGVTTPIISENGNLINQSILFQEKSTLFYSKEFEKIYFNKEDFYKEIEI